MADISKLELMLFENFNKNLEFLKSKDEGLFNKINLLSEAINQGLYKERFFLEYINEDNEFDIFDGETQTYLYYRKPKEMISKLVDNIDKSHKQLFSINDNGLFVRGDRNIELTSNERYDVLNQRLYNDLFKYFEIFGPLNDTNFKEIDKFIFLGTHLSKHMQKIDKKLKCKNYFIYDSNLEIFRLSLFTINYQKSLSSDIIFSIMDSDDVFNNKIQVFLETNNYSNYNIKYSKLNYITDMELNKFLTNFHISKNSYFDYTKILYDVFASTSKNFSKKRRFLELKSNEYSIDIPVVFVGAGPSLNENIDWLKENQNKFIIAAMGATYKKLIENSIRVDIIFTVDPKYSILSKSHFKPEDKIKLENKIVIASVNTPEKILNLFSSEKLFLYETLIPIKDNSNAYIGASVGEIALSILLDLNFINIYLLGIDLTISDSGKTHYDGYSNSKHNKIDLDSTNSVFLNGKSENLDKDIITIKKNNNQTGLTTRMFALSLNIYTTMIASKKKVGQKIFNLSENAAFIENVEYLSLENLILSDIKDTSIEEFILYKLLLEKSSCQISLSEKKLINKNMEFLNSFDFKRYFNFKTIEEFKIRLEKLIVKLLNNNDDILNLILSNYFNLILPYIYNSCNYEKFDKSEDKLKKFKQEFIKQLELLINDYLFYLKEIEKKYN